MNLFRARDHSGWSNWARETEPCFCAWRGVWRHWATAQVTLLDRQDLVSAETRRAFAALNWSVENVATDVFAWLERPARPVDLMLASLFLHHFPPKSLMALLRLSATRTNRFIACEPRRSPLALTAARWLGLLGCNGIMQHDAIISVRAGFVATNSRCSGQRIPAGE